MTRGRSEIDVDDAIVSEGDALYDTKYDRALWIAEIGDYDVMIEPATSYDVGETIGWTPSDPGQPRIEDGTSVTIEVFKSLVATGRFELSP